MLSKILGAAVTTLLVVAALGLASWFAFSAATGATLITFRTGSMSPTMPQGALALSMPVKAGDIEVDDVVTVKRSGEELPVTHRVVEVRDADYATQEQRIPDDARELVLKGDDNATIDMLPYVVKDARRVVFATPQAGAALMLMQSPIGLGVLILLAGTVTTWAFWPKREVGSVDVDDASTPDEPATRNDALEVDA
ncbi:signal peptidase I [Leucobacter sp. HY1908]